MIQLTRRLNLGLPLADSRVVDLSYSHERAVLKLVFETGIGPERLLGVSFVRTAAFRLQKAEFSIDGKDSMDGSYEVRDSAWLKIHAEQGYVDASDVPAYGHYKLVFGGSSPMLEVLCTEVILDPTY